MSCPRRANRSFWRGTLPHAPWRRRKESALADEEEEEEGVKERRDELVLPDVALFLLRVLLVELIDCPFGFRDGLLALGFGGFVPSLDLLSLLFAPLPARMSQSQQTQAGRGARHT